MGTKNLPGEFDCYAAADPDEPLFVLLGRDRHAPTLVRLWALMRHRDGERDKKIAEALACAAAMDRHLRVIGRPRYGHGIRENILLAATAGLPDHPDDYDDVCDCDECRGYQ